MTDNMQRARELLAAEHRKCERYTEADLIEAGDVTALGRMALNAIEAALRLSAGADWVLAALNNGFVVRKQAPLDYLTDEANAKTAWGVYRESPTPPHCDKHGTHSWFASTPEDAVRAAFKAMGIAAAPRHETGEG